AGRNHHPNKASGARQSGRLLSRLWTATPGVVYHFDLMGKLSPPAVDRSKLLRESDWKYQGVAMEQLVERVKAILLTPQTEWPIIAREAGDTAALFTRYVAFLALIPALAGFIGMSLIGRYVPFFSGLMSAIVSYVMAFVVTFVVALIV